MGTVVTLTAPNIVLLLTGTFTSDRPLPPPTLPWRLTYTCDNGHSYFTQQRSFANRYFHKWHTSPSIHTPLTLDLHMGTVATLTSLYNVPLLTSIDVVSLMKTAGVVENSWHCVYSIGLKCFWNCLSLFHLVFHLCPYLYIYIYQHLYIYISTASTASRGGYVPYLPANPENPRFVDVVLYAYLWYYIS